MKDSKNFMAMKSNAMGSKSSQGNTEVSSGYKIHHLMMVAIIGMLAGAYLQLKVLTPQVPGAPGAASSDMWLPNRIEYTLNRWNNKFIQGSI